MGAMSGWLASSVLSDLAEREPDANPVVRGSMAKVREVLREAPPDPLARLMDPDWTDSPWEYEFSETDPVIPGSQHPKQVVATEDRSRHKWLFWGNQVGKTTWGAIQCALWALGRHPWQPWQPPLRIWASALTWALWEEIVLPELLTWIPRNRIIDAPPPNRQSSKRTILVRADNGRVTRIIGKSAEQGRGQYQSARIHVFWQDEEHPLAVWQEVQPRLVRFGGVTIATMTPLLGLTWVYHDHYEPWKRGQKRETFCSHAGLADNPSIEPEEIERVKREFAGDPAQLAARLYGKFTRPAGIAIMFDPRKHMQSWTEPALKYALETRKWTQYCGIDFGHWRFAFVHLASDPAKRSHVVAEYFSQREDLQTRATWIHEHLDRHGAPPETRMWGDAANPTDIVELNKEFKRIGSPYRCRAVQQDRKLRQASVTKINNLLGRGALLIRKDVGSFAKWRLHQSAATHGRLVIGSRLLWEFQNWRYPAPRNLGEDRQRQDPNDDTADGADCIAALRYAIMSYYPAAPKPKRPKRKLNRNIDTGLEDLHERMNWSPNAD